MATSSTITPDKQATYHEACNKYVESGFTRNVTVKFLMERLIGLGCNPPKGFVRCIDCGDKMAGGGFGVIEETILPESMNTSINESKNYQNYKAGAKERDKSEYLLYLSKVDMRSTVSMSLIIDNQYIFSFLYHQTILLSTGNFENRNEEVWERISKFQ